MIPMMIGMFAVSEVMRFVVDTSPPAELVVEKVGNIFSGQWALAKKYPVSDPARQRLGTRWARCPAPARTSRRGCRTP